MASTNGWAEIDSELTKPGANYEKVIAKLRKMEKDDVDYYWRMAQATYYKSLNTLEEAEIKRLTNEAYQFAKKGTELQDEHPHANKWAAMTVGKLALMETNFANKVLKVIPHIEHLNKSREKLPFDPWILYMEGRLHLALASLREAEKKGLEQAMGYMPVIDIELSEKKFRKSLELNPDSVDCYLALIHLLVRTARFDEARKMAEEGLKVNTYTKSDEAIHKELDQIRETLIAQPTPFTGCCG